MEVNVSIAENIYVSLILINIFFFEILLLGSSSFQFYFRCIKCDSNKA